MHMFKFSLVPILFFVSCKSTESRKENQPVPKPIIIEKTDVIRKEFPQVDYVY